MQLELLTVDSLNTIDNVHQCFCAAASSADKEKVSSTVCNILFTCILSPRHLSTAFTHFLILDYTFFLILSLLHLPPFASTTSSNIQLLEGFEKVLHNPPHIMKLTMHVLWIQGR